MKPGDTVSYLGDPLPDHFWAYLGNVSITSEIPPGDIATFWAARPEERQKA